jgi:hypothetical protein
VCTKQLEGLCSAGFRRPDKAVDLRVSWWPFRRVRHHYSGLLAALRLCQLAASVPGLPTRKEPTERRFSAGWRARLRRTAGSVWTAHIGAVGSAAAVAGGAAGARCARGSARRRRHCAALRRRAGGVLFRVLRLGIARVLSDLMSACMLSNWTIRLPYPVASSAPMVRCCQPRSCDQLSITCRM